MLSASSAEPACNWQQAIELEKDGSRLEHTAPGHAGEAYTDAGDILASCADGSRGPLPKYKMRRAAISDYLQGYRLLEPIQEANAPDVPVPANETKIWNQSSRLCGDESAPKDLRASACASARELGQELAAIYARAQASNAYYNSPRYSGP
jgi:hypothetical protein